MPGLDPRSDIAFDALDPKRSENASAQKYFFMGNALAGACDVIFYGQRTGWSM
jgi:hypothetical protein